MKCPLYEMSIYEMSIYEMSIYEMSIYEMSIYEMSQRHYLLQDEKRQYLVIYRERFEVI